MIAYVVPSAGIFGGIKVAYQFVDLLQDQGVATCIATPDGKASGWFRSRAPVVSRAWALDRLGDDDALMFSLPHDHAELKRTALPLFFHCQGTDPLIDPVLRDPDVAVLTCWQQAQDYAHATSGREAIDVGISISPAFHHRGELKDPHVATYMPRRGREVAERLAPEPRRPVAFDLPWPWAGERFEIRDIRPLTYITGPLGSGKTRLAQRLAETLPGAAFLGLDRAPIETGPALEARVERALARLVEDGATASPALAALLRGLEAKGPQALVVDLVEQGLDRASQEALIARLRRRGRETRPLFVMTRSTAILDLDAVGPYEAILYCPANHAVPMGVVPCPGAAGYEALASCLASPEVRARSEGVIAWRS